MLPSHSLPDLGARGKGKGRARSRGKPPRRGSGGRVLAGIAEVAWEAEYKDAAVRDSPAAVTAYKGPRSLLGSKRGNYNRPGTAPMAMSSSNDGGDGGVDGYDPQVPKRSALYEINDLRALMSSNPALLRQDDTQKSMAQLQRQTKVGVSVCVFVSEWLFDEHMCYIHIPLRTYVATRRRTDKPNALTQTAASGNASHCSPTPWCGTTPAAT
jgi:hypothetical protein